MHSKIPIFFALLGIAAVPLLTGGAYGHGLGGDVAPPIDFEGEQVTVSTQMNPADITVGEVDSANMAIRFYNEDTNSTLNSVTYRVEVWRSDDLLARNLFYDDDGFLNIEVRPVYDCNEVDLWRCTTYAGSEHSVSPGALYVFGEGRPLITGPIFDKGGLYNIKVTIEGATSPRTIVASPLKYDTFVSVAQEQPFSIQTASAETPVVVKTYYDEVDNFAYDSSDNSIGFDMPFDWSPDYIQYVSVVHQELQLPKSFAPYMDVTQFRGFVDGVEVEQRVLVLDPYSSEDTNTIHFLVNGEELKRINSVLGPQHEQSPTMEFKLVPQAGVTKNSLGFFLVDVETFDDTGTTVNISWDEKYVAGDEIPFEISFFDKNKELIKDVRYAYYLIDSAENILLEVGTTKDSSGDLGISAFEGIDIQKITLPSSDTYRLDIRVLGTGINYDSTYAGIGSTIFEIGSDGSIVPRALPDPAPTQTETVSIPEWVKNNARWWAEGSIDDAAFATGIEFMIKQGIISIPTTEGRQGGGAEIPEWVRSNADWWSQDLITDEDFAGGLQYLIANGIITV